MRDASGAIDFRLYRYRSHVVSGHETHLWQSLGGGGRVEHGMLHDCVSCVAPINPFNAELTFF